MLDHSSPLVISTFGANRVRWDGAAALWAVTDLAFVELIVGAAAAGTSV
ncbi:hypothetical protein Poly59_19500 [Rubripirellula reticaptiva]|uniref:Uncharacterized protein n=1 Tax=Rubripirellula reticaptiva TaxID=2528013 RepID=A0A5C6F551_9BACT|nr:hypothetical protein Poly59_19500 [Rubripirellula reticaptiva]